MQEIRPDRSRAGGFFLLWLALFAYVFLRLTAGPATLNDIGWRGGLALFLAAVPMGASFLMLLLRRPFLRWNGTGVVKVGFFGREQRLDFAQFGPVIAWSQRTRGGYIYQLLLRPLNGEKLVSLSLPPMEMSPEKLEALANAMNRSRGLPEGPADAATLAAFQKLQFDTGVNGLAVMLYAPLIAFALAFLFSL